MQTPEYVGSSAARMIVALMVFVGVVTAGVWFAVRPTGVAEKLNETKEVAETAATESDSPFFYKSIGIGPDAATAAPSAPLKVSYTLELKVATSKDEAEKMIDELEAQGIEAYFTPLSRQGHVVYRVRRGIFPSQKAATKAAVALKEQHQVGARVVKLQ